MEMRGSPGDLFQEPVEREQEGEGGIKRKREEEEEEVVRETPPSQRNKPAEEVRIQDLPAGAITMVNLANFQRIKKSNIKFSEINYLDGSRAGCVLNGMHLALSPFKAGKDYSKFIKTKGRPCFVEVHISNRGKRALDPEKNGNSFIIRLEISGAGFETFACNEKNEKVQLEEIYSQFHLQLQNPLMICHFEQESKLLESEVLTVAFHDALGLVDPIEDITEGKKHLALERLYSGLKRKQLADQLEEHEQFISKTLEISKQISEIGVSIKIEELREFEMFIEKQKEKLTQAELKYRESMNQTSKFMASLAEKITLKELLSQGEDVSKMEEQMTALKGELAHERIQFQNTRQSLNDHLKIIRETFNKIQAIGDEEGGQVELKDLFPVDPKLVEEKINLIEEKLRHQNELEKGLGGKEEEIERLVEAINLKKRVTVLDLEIAQLEESVVAIKEILFADYQRKEAIFRQILKFLTILELCKAEIGPFVEPALKGVDLLGLQHLLQQQLEARLDEQTEHNNEANSIKGEMKSLAKKEAAIQKEIEGLDLMEKKNLQVYSRRQRILLQLEKQFKELAIELQFEACLFTSCNKIHLELPNGKEKQEEMTLSLLLASASHTPFPFLIFELPSDFDQKIITRLEKRMDLGKQFIFFFSG